MSNSPSLSFRTGTFLKFMPEGPPLLVLLVGYRSIIRFPVMSNMLTGVLLQATPVGCTPPGPASRGSPVTGSHWTAVKAYRLTRSVNPSLFLVAGKSIVLGRGTPKGCRLKSPFFIGGVGIGIR